MRRQSNRLVKKKSGRQLGRLIAFEAWHLDWLDSNNINGLGLANIISESDAKLIETVCTSWTGIQDGKIVGCGGFTPQWTGVADIWMYLQPDAFKRKKVALKLMKYVLNDIIERKQFHRIQAVVLKDYKEGIRFAEFFGFKNEGLMRQYSMNKEDFHRYSIIIK
tara:strand:+ start:235 stop:726 length:492 start_codon:yes stop_codon:yes gene_type:complete